MQLSELLVIIKSANTMRKTKVENYFQNPLKLFEAGHTIFLT